MTSAHSGHHRDGHTVDIVTHSQSGQFPVVCNTVHAVDGHHNTVAKRTSFKSSATQSQSGHHLSRLQQSQSGHHSSRLQHSHKADIIQVVCNTVTKRTSFKSSATQSQSGHHSSRRQQSQTKITSFAPHTQIGLSRLLQHFIFVTYWTKLVCKRRQNM